MAVRTSESAATRPLAASISTFMGALRGLEVVGTSSVSAEGLPPLTFAVEVA